MAYTRTVYGEPGSSSSPGQPGTYTSLNLNDAVNQIVLDADAAVNKGTITMAALTAARTWTLPDATTTVVGTDATQTLTNKTLTAAALTSPVVTTGTVAADPAVALGIASKQYVDARVPTVTLKTGSGAGNYTTTSATYVRVDSTNLAFTVTVPIGQKIMIRAVSSVFASVAAASFIALADGTADNTGILIERGADSNLVNAPSVSWVFTGDGASHTFNLQWKIAGGNTLTMQNSSATIKPTMTFWMGVTS